MKILIINTVATIKNGITNVIFNYLNAINDSEITFDLLCINKPDSYFVKSIEDRGGRVYVVSRKATSLFSYWNNLRKIVKQNKYHAVHIHGNSHTLVLELSAARLGGCKVNMVHAHSSHCKYVVPHIILQPFFNILCSYRLACGEKAGRFMFGKQPFMIVNNGVNTVRYAFDGMRREEVRKHLHFEDNVIVGHVGNFVRVKNHSFLVDVFEKLYQSNTQFRLLLIGDGILREEIEKLLEQKGLADVVHFTGSISNVDDYLNAIDMIIMPSLFEGLPLSLVEQQANGLQCVVSDTVSSEADLTGNICFLPLNTSADGWVTKVNELIDLEHRMERSKTSIKQIENKGYSIQKEASKLKDYYHKAILEQQ